MKYQNAFGGNALTILKKNTIWYNGKTYCNLLLFNAIFS